MLVLLGHGRRQQHDVLVEASSCRGSGEWVHQDCLLVWIEEKSKQNGGAKIRCPQCKVEYLIFIPKRKGVLSLMESIDAFVNRATLWLASGVTVIIIYWAASSYGAFTILQVFGEADGKQLLKGMDPLAFCLILPNIPITLNIMELLHWEDHLLAFLRRGSRYPVLRHILPSIVYKEVLVELVEIKPRVELLFSSRTFASALFFPTAATIFGNVFFHSEWSALKRCLLGGLTFTAIKGVFKMYYKQKSYIHEHQRRVLNQGERVE